MLKLYKIISFGLLSLALSSAAWAQVEFNTSTNREVKQLRATGFLNYPPFGVFKNPSVPASYFNIFQPVIANYAKYANFMVDYTTNYSYPELVRMVRGGKIDILAGVKGSGGTGASGVFPFGFSGKSVAVGFAIPSHTDSTIFFFNRISRLSTLFLTQCVAKTNGIVPSQIFHWEIFADMGTWIDTHYTFIQSFKKDC